MTSLCHNCMQKRAQHECKRCLGMSFCGERCSAESAAHERLCYDASSTDAEYVAHQLLRALPVLCDETRYSVGEAATATRCVEGLMQDDSTAELQQELLTLGHCILQDAYFSQPLVAAGFLDRLKERRKEKQEKRKEKKTARQEKKAERREKRKEKLQSYKDWWARVRGKEKSVDAQLLWHHWLNPELEGPRLTPNSPLSAHLLEVQETCR